MQARRFWVPACLALFASAAAFGCGEDEGTKPAVTCDDCRPSLGGDDTFGGGDTFSEGGNGAAPLGGVSSVAGTAALGGSSVGLGGAGAEPGGGSRNTGGVNDVGGAPVANGGAAGTPSETIGEQLELCVRFNQQAIHADTVSRAYAKAVFADCRVKWIVPTDNLELADYRNDLKTWSYDFWGCADAAPVDTFGLVYQAPPLSRGDVNILIDYYMVAADDDLALSTPEYDSMVAAMLRLAEPLITDQSFGPSNSGCATNAGGAGGADAGGAANSGGTSNAGAPADASGGAL